MLLDEPAAGWHELQPLETLVTNAEKQTSQSAMDGEGAKSRG